MQPVAEYQRKENTRSQNKAQIIKALQRRQREYANTHRDGGD